MSNEAPDHVIVADMIRRLGASQPQVTAIIAGDDTLTFGDLDREMDRIAAALQQAGCAPGDAIALCGLNSVAYALLFMGALRAGVAPALIAPSSTPKAIAKMTRNCDARLLFLDEDLMADVAPHLGDDVPQLALTGAAIDSWYADAPDQPRPVTVDLDGPFNIIYSSGTTGDPKGIVQSHRMRSAHVSRGGDLGYGPEAVTILATPLYSNTTLVCFLPTIALGGTVVLMRKFKAADYMALAARHRATHTMLVPVQYKRIMALDNFDDVDLSSFRLKFCTSAPFAAALKADILKRWPGGLVEYYGMTEGGGSCALLAHEHPDKLHTVGKPLEGHDMRLIDEDGVEVAPGEIGEVVGRSGSMMTGYYGRKDQTRETEWYSPEGLRFIRTGDVGRFDADGFLTLMDRKKDMIISGGFNIYPSDLEAELITHPDITDVAVIGVPSEDWGETPVAVVVLRSGAVRDGDAIRDWLAARVGKTQRVSDVQFLDKLPRSAIGKVLKRELRDRYISGRQPRPDDDGPPAG